MSPEDNSLDTWVIWLKKGLKAAGKKAGMETGENVDFVWQPHGTRKSAQKTNYKL